VHRIILFLILLIATTLTAHTAVINVPADQPTIQAGIDAAVDGDTVLVADGTWRGPGNRDIEFHGKAITLQSENGPLTCIIDAEGSPGSPRRCFIFYGEEDRDSILRGFTITGGFRPGVGGGLIIQQSNPTITGNIITGNRAEQGGGIACVMAGPWIEQNIISGNNSSTVCRGGGLYAEYSTARIIDNLFLENIVNGPGGAIYLDRGDYLIEGNRFIDNASEGAGTGLYGGAMYISNLYRETEIRNNIFTGNRADYGGAIHCIGADPVFADNVFENNQAPNGGAVKCILSLPRFENCRFSGNHASWGAAVNCENECNVTIANCLFADNVAGYSGGCIQCAIVSTVSVQGCTFAGNEALISHGGAVSTNSGCNFIIEDSILWNNGAPEGPEIAIGATDALYVSYSDVEGGRIEVLSYPESIIEWGPGVIDADPMFVSDALGDHFLSHIATGQNLDSPCIDAGDPASDLPAGSTRTDFTPDSGIVDMGYHRHTAGRLVAGPGPGPDNPPEVRLFIPGEDADPQLAFTAYGVPRYGVNLAVGDLLGVDGRQIVTGPGPGAMFGPHVRAFEADGDPINKISFFAYGTHKWGVNVACANLHGYYPGSDSIVTGAGPGAVFGPHVRAFRIDEFGSIIPVPGVSFLAYGTNKWGVNVACGDIDGDSCDEIVTGAGPGAVFGPHVRGWNVDGLPARAMPGVSFLAYGTHKWGVNVACGDIDGDGIDEILTAPGPSGLFGAHIRGWDHDGTTMSPMPEVSFFAWDTTVATHGATIHGGPDLDRDGRDEIIVGTGPDPDGASLIQVFRFDGVETGRWFGLSPFSDMTHGTTVAAGWLGSEDIR